MTPIGHFMCNTAVAGTCDVTTEKETGLCFAYYVLFLTTFAVLAQVFVPGKWAMYVHDWFGNAALIYFLIAWSRKETRKQCFVCILIGGQILSAYTHMFDVIVLKLLGYIPEGMWRPHNILHTPLAAFIIPAIAAPLVKLFMPGLKASRAYFFMAVGYILHILMDTATYGFYVYALWPLSDWSVSLINVFQQPDVQSAYLGSPLYIFEKSTVENIDGFILYQSEVAINLLLAALFGVKVITKRLLQRNG